MRNVVVSGGIGPSRRPEADRAGRIGHQHEQAGGQVGFAALDVFEAEPLPADNPLWERDDVLVSPHTAALNAAEERLIAELFATNATRFLDGESMLNRVNTVEFY